MSDKIDDICRDFLFLLANQTFQTDCCNLLEQLLKIFEIERWCCQITVKIPFILMTVGYWGNMYTNLFKFSEELFCSLTVVFLIETIQEYFPPNSFFFFLTHTLYPIVVVLTKGWFCPEGNILQFGDIFDCPIWGRRLLLASRWLRAGMLLNILECKVQSPQPRISQSKVSAVPVINPAQGTASPTQCVDRWGFPGGPVVKNPLPMQAARDRSSIPGVGKSLRRRATHSSIVAWRIPWTEAPGGLQSRGSQRMGHDWVSEYPSMHIYMYS